MRPSLAMTPVFDELITSLAKLDTLLKVAANANIAELKEDILFNYFWVEEDTLENARRACTNLLRDCI